VVQAVMSFAFAKLRNCIADEYMNRSVYQERLQELKKDECSFEEVISRLIRRAFELKPDRVVQTFVGRVPNIQDQNCNVYERCVWFYEHLYRDEKKKILSCALQRLLETEDVTGLQIVTGMMLRASFECDARKHYVFEAILNRLRLEKKRGKLEACVADFLEMYKEKAFNSVFVEPSKVYFKLTRNCKEFFDFVI
jgi:hypothetical protein